MTTKSGRPGSNRPPEAWKATALPNELLPLIKIFQKTNYNLKVGSGGFEPPKSKTADLQSAPFGHSGNCPNQLAIGNMQFRNQQS
jgi:hypothetical protein